MEDFKHVVKRCEQHLFLSGEHSNWCDRTIAATEERRASYKDFDLVPQSEFHRGGDRLIGLSNKKLQMLSRKRGR